MHTLLVLSLYVGTCALVEESYNLKFSAPKQSLAIAMKQIIQTVFVVFLAVTSVIRPIGACPFIGYAVGGLSPHDSSDTKEEPSLKEDVHVLDRRMRKRFERHVVKKQL